MAPWMQRWCCVQSTVMQTAAGCKPVRVWCPIPGQNASGKKLAKNCALSGCISMQKTHLERWLEPFQHIHRHWMGCLSARLNLPQDVKLSVLPVPEVREAMSTWPCDAVQLPTCTATSAKRHTEFIAGRLCAALALQDMHVVAEFPLPIHDRLPLWPSRILGSISHCTKLAAAITVTRSNYQALGIDVECLIPSATARAIQPNICRHEELVHLNQHISDQARSLTMLFSAKEALYKALFPSVRRFMDFDTAEFCSCEDGVIALQLTRDWTTRWCAGTRIAVRYAWVGSVIVTVVCVQNDSP